MNKNLTKTKIEKCKHTWERKLSLNYLGYLFFIHVYNEILSCAFPTSMIIKKLLHKSQDDKSTVQNSGVSLKVESQYFAIINDDNPRLASMPLESLKKYGNLIMLNSLCVFLSVNKLTTISMCELMILDLLW